MLKYSEDSVSEFIKYDCKIKNNTICEDIAIICEDSNIVYDDSDAENDSYILLSSKTFTQLCNMVAGKFEVQSQHLDRLKNITAKKNKSKNIKLKSTRIRYDKNSNAYYETVFTAPIKYFGNDYYSEIGNDTLVNEYFGDFYPDRLTCNLENTEDDIINYNYILENSFLYDFEKGTLYITLKTTNPISINFIG